MSATWTWGLSCACFFHDWSLWWLIANILYLFFFSLFFFPCLLFVDCSIFLIMLCTSRLVYSPSDLPVSSVLVYTRADLYYLLPTNYSSTTILWNISYLFIICLFVRELCNWFVSGARACVRTIRSSFIEFFLGVSACAVLSCLTEFEYITLDILSGPSVVLITVDFQ